MPGDPPCPGCGWQPDPVLIHGGIYELWRTPGGGLRVRFLRQRGTHPDTGEVTGIEDAEPEWLPEMPGQVVDLLDRMSATGERPSPAALMRTMLGAMGGGNGAG